MANVTTDARSDLYGHSKLYQRTNYDITAVYSESGSNAFPLGHDPDTSNTGFVFDLSPGSKTSGHSLFVGATRSGKLVSCIAPALLTCLSSCVVVDPKLETAWITAPRRRALGHRVVILDPWNEINERYGKQVGIVEEITRFNPLSSLDPKSRDFNDDIAAIADALVIVDPNDENSHWTASAKTLIAGLIACVVELNPGKASLRDVREKLTRDDDELARFILETRDKIPNSLGVRKLRKFAKMAETAMKGDKSQPNTPQTGLATAEDIAHADATDSKDYSKLKAATTTELSSIRSTAETQTDILDSETLLESLETDQQPFDLEDLVTGKVTLYIGLPPDRLTTHGRWLRLILTLALRTIARAKKPPALPIMFFIDEMGTIGPLKMIEDSYGLLAGLGVRISGYLQDLNQLRRDYPYSWETFISNSSVIGVLQCADDSTAKYISDYLGTKTIEVNQGESLHVRPAQNAEQRSSSKGHLLRGAISGAANSMGGDVQEAQRKSLQREVWEPDLSFQGRPVLFPSEVRDSPRDEIILIVPGEYNLRLKRFLYYSDPVFSKWARPDPNKAVGPVPATRPTLAAPVLVAAPGPVRTPQEVVADKAVAAAGRAASALGGFIKNKLDEKLNGR